MVAISPILLYIGMLIGAQAFQETPNNHAPAIVLALAPHLAGWGKSQIDGALGAAAPTPQRSVSTSSARSACFTRALGLGAGSILTELIMGAVAAFIIDQANSFRPPLSPSPGPCSRSSASCVANPSASR